MQTNGRCRGKQDLVRQGKQIKWPECRIWLVICDLSNTCKSRKWYTRKSKYSSVSSWHTGLPASPKWVRFASKSLRGMSASKFWIALCDNRRCCSCFSWIILFGMHVIAWINNHICRYQWGKIIWGKIRRKPRRSNIYISAEIKFGQAGEVGKSFDGLQTVVREIEYSQMAQLIQA